MSTMIGCTVEQEATANGGLLQSLMLLVRKLMSWDEKEFMPNVPTRVWRRHSALLTMLIQQDNSEVVLPTKAE